VKRGSAAELRLCSGQGASLGEDAVSADAGRLGEVAAGVGRVRSLAFLSILRGRVLLFQTGKALDFRRAVIIFLHPASPSQA